MRSWRMQLNAGFVGPQAWLFLAIRRGHVSRAGVELSLTPGNGAWLAAGAMQRSGHELGHGDLHALLALHAAEPARAPRAVFATHNRTPAAIAVAAEGPVATARDLAGGRLLGHASDVAAQLFPAFAAASGLDPAGVTIEHADHAMRALLDRLATRGTDGVFGYVSTQSAALAASRREASRELRFLRYAEALPALYGSAVFASPRVLAEEAERLAALLEGFRQGIDEAVADPEAAIAALISFAPEADPRVERLRFEVALAEEMGHPEAATLPRGTADPQRLAQGLAAVSASLGLGAPPASLLAGVLAP